jgi:uncharacterized protein (TIGR02246 family)
MKLPSLFSTIIILFTTFFLGYQDISAQTEDYEQIQQNWRQFIENWNAMNTNGCVAIYADDAIVIPPEMQPANGKEAIAEFYDFLFASNKSANYSHNTESITIEGNQAIEYGNFSVDWISNEDIEWTFRARVMAHWVKDSSENWRIRKLLFNTPPAQN